MIYQNFMIYLNHKFQQAFSTRDQMDMKLYLILTCPCANLFCYQQEP